MQINKTMYNIYIYIYIHTYRQALPAAPGARLERRGVIRVIVL